LKAISFPPQRKSSRAAARDMQQAAKNGDVLGKEEHLEECLVGWRRPERRVRAGVLRQNHSLCVL
jgi:hypothetical protein